MKTQTDEMRVEEGRTKLTVTHNGEDLTFIHPYFGPGTYSEVGNLIDQAKPKLLKPTLAQTASLVNTAFNSKDRYSQEIVGLMKKGWLWGFTRILYIPKEGAYFKDNTEVKDEKPYLERSELVKKLEQNEPSVRFVPFGFKLGEMTPEELRKNQFVIGLVGEEGADKLAEVAGKHRLNPVVYGLESVENIETRVSALDSGRGAVRLVVDGYDRGYDGDGIAFGYVPK
ncbi:MAG: hypothetical protein AABW58_00610, partial [Nanoarchaeota archaeon]